MAEIHSFDIVCKVNLQEVDNAIHQAKQEIAHRFDFRGSIANIERQELTVALTADDDYKLKALVDLFQLKLTKRSVPLKALSFETPEKRAGGSLRQEVKLQQGIPQDKAKEITKLIKGLRYKCDTQIQGDQVRALSKSIDDLQEVMKALREKDLGIALQFVNYR